MAGKQIHKQEVDLRIQKSSYRGTVKDEEMLFKKGKLIVQCVRKCKKRKACGKRLYSTVTQPAIVLIISHTFLIILGLCK